MKKIIAMLLALTLVFTMMPLVASANSDTDCCVVKTVNYCHAKALEKAKEQAKNDIRKAAGKEPTATMWGLIDRYIDSDIEGGCIIDNQNSLTKIKLVKNKALREIKKQKKSDMLYDIKVKCEQAQVIIKALISMARN